MTELVHDPLRVCHVIHSLGPGGAESVLVDLATVAPTAGMALSVVSLTRADSAVNAQRLQQLGTPVTWLDAGNPWDPRSVPHAVRAVSRTRPDIIHTHLKHADLIGAAAARRLGVPLVSTLHLLEEAVTPVGRGKRWLAAQARARAAAATIAVSAALREWYLETFRVDPRRVHVVPNGILRPELDATVRSRIRGALGLPENAVVAIMVGIMRPGKGHRELLDAIRHIDPAIRFLLVGDGPLRADLEARAACLPPRQVFFTGYRPDVTELMAASDLVVHPSRFDALPTALLSALAVGRPIVASDVGGIPEIVTSDVGILVPPNHPAALAAAVTALAGDPAARAALGTAAVLRYEAHFEAGRWARALRSLYDEVRTPCAVPA